MNGITVRGATQHSDGPFQAGQIFRLLDDNAVVVLSISTKNGTGVLVNLSTGQNRRLPVLVSSVDSVSAYEISKMTGNVAYVVCGDVTVTCPPPKKPVRTTSVGNVPIVADQNDGRLQINGYSFSRSQARDLAAFIQASL